MVARRYVEESTLSGHSDTVIAVAFSPDARYLASASEDGVILVFSTTSWKPIRRFVDVSPASALIWHPTFKNTIICGFKNGDVLTFCFEHGDRVRPFTNVQRSAKLTLSIGNEPQEGMGRWIRWLSRMHWLRSRWKDPCARPWEPCFFGRSSHCLYAFSCPRFSQIL